MNDKVKNILLGVSAVTALALGGAAIAGAASGNDAANSTAAATTQSNDVRPQGLPPQRSDETLLSGDTAAKVTAAAKAELPGATIERVETDADGNAKYEAHVQKADGSRATVYVNDNFEVVSVDSR
ncbi:MAG TPA: hypothetical protein VFP31_12185 [Gaiellaceae bacterium]|nr:hypothetical protein [Gaiellaceae bacterium]